MKETSKETNPPEFEDCLRLFHRSFVPSRNGSERRFGEILVAKGHLRVDALQECLEAQARAPERVPIGYWLLKKGLVSAQQLLDALFEQERRPGADAHSVLGPRTTDARSHVRTPDALGYHTNPAGLPAENTHDANVQRLAGQTNGVSPESGATFGERYRILHLLGRGAMGEVFLAEDLRLRRLVALKLLSDQIFGAADSRTRFEREARALSSLSHPNIVSLLDFGEDGSRLFLVLEYVEGETLRETLERRGLSLPARLRILVAVADGVHHAHERGIVHRDLKPENILIRGDSFPKVVDFGIARLPQATAGLTRSGVVFGTPLYMAPEQVRGDGKEISPRTDVHALGAILYEMLTGAPPYSYGEDKEVYSRILGEAPVPPRKRGARIDRDLETVCLKALEKVPARRYATAGEFAEDLARAMRGEPVRARRPSFVERWWRKARRRKEVTASIGAGIAAASLALALVVPRLVRERKARVATEEQAAQAAAASGERENSIRELGALWMKIVLAKKDFYIESRDPAETRERIERGIDEVSDYIVRHPDQPQAHYIRARGRLYLNDLDGAEKDLIQATRFDSNFSPAYDILGQVEIARYHHSLWVTQRGESRERELAECLSTAMNYFQRGTSGHAENENRWGLPRTEEDEISAIRVKAYQLAGSNGQGVEAARRYLQAAVESLGAAELWYHLATISPPGSDDFKRAIREAIRRRPHYADAFLLRGTERFRQLDFVGAVEDCTHAITLHPRFAVAYSNRGSVRVEKGDLVGAIDDFAKAIEIDPQSHAVFSRRGNALFNKGDFERALGDFTQSIARNPRYSEAYNNRGCVLDRIGDIEGAIGDYTKAIELDPLCVPAYLGRGAARGKKGELDGEIDDYTKAVAIDCRCAFAFYHRGTAGLKKGDLDGAIEDLTRAIELDPKLDGAYSNRGTARSRKDDLGGAIGDYTKAILLNPQAADAYANRGVCRQSLHDRFGALSDYRRALEVAPPDWSDQARTEALLQELEGK